MQRGNRGREKLTLPRGQTGTASSSPDSKSPHSLLPLNKDLHTIATCVGLEWNPIPSSPGLGSCPSSRILAILGQEGRRKQGSVRTNELHVGLLVSGMILGGAAAQLPGGRS